VPFLKLDGTKLAQKTCLARASCRFVHACCHYEN